MSPDKKEYLMKYPRESEVERVNWEDVNEVIAAKIASILGIKVINAEIATRHGKRGCLMVHFLRQFNAQQGEGGTALLVSQFGKEFENLKDSPFKNQELLKIGFNFLEEFSYFPLIKDEFLLMNVFDILIGNQDRHPLNWQILFGEDGEDFFGPLYDNGASLGWQIPESKLTEMLEDESKMNRFYKKTKVKCGLFEHTQPPVKVNDVLELLIARYPEEMTDICVRLELFNQEAYNQYIEEMTLISEIRKDFLKEFISFRKQKIIDTIRKEEGTNGRD